MCFEGEVFYFQGTFEQKAFFNSSFDIVCIVGIYTCFGFFGAYGECKFDFVLVYTDYFFVCIFFMVGKSFSYDTKIA